MKELNRDAIRDMLAKELAVLNKNDTFDGEVLRSTLGDAGYQTVDNYSNDKLNALAAALEFFDGDIEQAIAAIERGNYRHYPDAYDCEELGRWIIDDECNGRTLPEIVLDYIDYETLGKDMERDLERGKFTNFGYFAPERW